MVELLVIVLASLVGVSIVTLGCCALFSWRAVREERLRNEHSIDHLTATLEKLAAENIKACDRVLAAKNSVAYSTVKHFESGNSIAAKLNARPERRVDV
jgi:hypothetical protein